MVLVYSIEKKYSPKFVIGSIQSKKTLAEGSLAEASEEHHQKISTARSRRKFCLVL